MPVPCRICTRPLRAPLSVMTGVGPVCLRRRRGQMQNLTNSLLRGDEVRNLIRNGRVSMNQVEALQARARSQSTDTFGGEATSEDRRLFFQLYGMSHAEMESLSDEIVRTTYRERRHAVRPTQEQITVQVGSSTQAEPSEVTVEWVTEHSALVHSGSGNSYVATPETCTCPHFVYRVRSHPERYPNGCRHMQAFHAAQDQIEQGQRDWNHEMAEIERVLLDFQMMSHEPRAHDAVRAAYRRARELYNVMPPDHELRSQAQELVLDFEQAMQRHSVDVSGTTVHRPEPTFEEMAAPLPAQPQNPPQVRPLFATANLTDDAMREEILNTWRETRAFDGVWMMEDDAAFHRLLEDAGNEWDLVTDGSALGGTGNTFGVEFEMVFGNGSDAASAIRELYNDGLSQSRDQMRYHAEQHSGMWTPTRDGSLSGGYGVEFVSPVLVDRPEDWEQVAHVLEVARRHGAAVNHTCGAHTNIGTGPMDSRTFNWQRLARAGVGHELTLYRIGGASSDRYRTSGQPGQHRGTSYASPFGSEIQIGENTDTATARRRISNNSRYTLFNCTHDNRIEMRYPNATLDIRQFQAQVIVANAMVHQAAVIKRNMPQDRTTPVLSDYAHQYRLSRRSEAAEEQAFRRFLDFLGSPLERRAAAWLWKRGRVSGN